MFGSGALSDIRVLDLTQMLAGPFCTQMLADQGAQIVKVEPPEGEGMRRMGPFLKDDDLRAFGGYFQSINRNKASLVLDLKTSEARDVLLKLVETSDVIVENYRSGVMDRLGLSYETIAARNPAIVYAAIRGFGDDRTGASPYGDWPAYDVVSQAMGGIMGITGPDPDTPTKVGPGIGDTVPALMLAIGILSAVHHARRTGKGQFVDVSMVDCVLALCERMVYQMSYQGRIPAPEGNRHPLLCPFGLFRAADGQVAIACANEVLWERTAIAIGRPDLVIDPRTATNVARVENAAFVIRSIEDFTSSRTKLELKQILGGKAAFGPVYTAADIFADPHFAARNMLVDVEHPGSSQSPAIAGIPIKMTETQGTINRRAPLLGEQTDMILLEAGFTVVEVAGLRESGAIY